MNEQLSNPSWHTLELEQVYHLQNVNPTSGLSAAEVEARLGRYGANELGEKAAKSPLQIIAEQFTNPLVLLLIGAGTISIALGKVIDSLAVFTIVVLNAILGFVQEYRAEKAMAALKRMSSPVVRVRRDGQVREIASAPVVPGDILLL